MSSKTYEKKCARALQDMFATEATARPYSECLRLVNEHMATVRDSMPSEVRASAIFVREHDAVLLHQLTGTNQ